MHFSTLISSTALIMATLALSLPTPASAAAAAAAASTPLIDLWQDANFLGLKFTGSSTVGTCVDLPKGFSDNVTSGKAKPGFRCTTWVDVKCKGTGFSFNEKPGSEKFPAWIDNKSSSWKCVAA